VLVGVPDKNVSWALLQLQVREEASLLFRVVVCGAVEERCIIVIGGLMHHTCGPECVEMEQLVLPTDIEFTLQQHVLWCLHTLCNISTMPSCEAPCIQKSGQ
jgi:hypothetical protein